MKKSSKKLYKCLIGCANDKNGKRFFPGDTVKQGDFTAKTIAEFVGAGVLEEMTVDGQSG